ncbi:hypothetical protein EXIGLDRAFT_736887 [Exidia glandulosa HHB12029]|uniref:Uncharacterized protein n=1 Tax=Exidia glandulosa HHB12029 TaxID=1314781 RepID=A0A165J978_EXIGL|nr:hypothetical protein EXIGLDRAFT_736887 [Exidia glandulosa HHB12029]
MKSPRLGVLGGSSDRAHPVLGIAAPDRLRASDAGAYRTDALPHARLVLAVIANDKRAT